MEEYFQFHLSIIDSTKMKTLGLYCTIMIIVGVAAFPSAFDIRFQPSNAVFGNYDPRPVTVCEAYDWAGEIAQVLSNAASIALEEKITLSGQNIVECLKGLVDPCLDVNVEDIRAALKYISEWGISESSCYQNRFFQLPGKFCKRSCSNGEQPLRNFKAIYQKENNILNLLTRIGNGEASGFLILEIYEAMNYYSAFSPTISAAGEHFSYAVAEIVGWKKKGQEIIVRVGSAGWGYKGYANIDVNSKAIIEFYSLNLLGYESNLGLVKE